MGDESPDPIRLVFGAMAAHTLGAAVRLGVPDALDDGGTTVDEAAVRVGGVPAEQLRRLLRAVAALGVATEPEPDRFVPTDAGRALRSGHPSRMYEFVRTFTDPVMLAAWPRLESSLRTGATAFDDMFGVPFFAHLAGDPEMSSLFNASMRAGTLRIAGPVAQAVDVGRFGTVVDVGGGDGTLLATVLAAHPSVRGIVYDSADGAEQATETLEAAGVAGRCSVETGDFFASVPAGGDAYLLKSIVHDWDDERAAAILRLCRDALPEQGRVLLVEPVLPDTVPPGGPPGAYLSDLNMLVNVGGRERTLADFETLFRSAGLEPAGVVTLPAGSGFAVLEAAPAS